MMTDTILKKTLLAKGWTTAVLLLLASSLLLARPIFGEHTSTTKNVVNDIGNRKILNLRYGEQPEAPYSSDTSSDRLLDLYLPVNTLDKKVPVLVFVHGGGFSGGDKSALSGLSQTLANKGYAVLSVNYRLYLKHHKFTGASARANMSKGLRADGKFHPAMQEAIKIATEDLKQVLSWVKQTQRQYNFDLDKLSVAGGSAGSMAILNLAYASQQNILPIRAAVNLSGGLQDASVIQKGAPPLLTFHGDKDDLIHVDYAYALERRMKELGLNSETHILKDQGHAMYKLIHKEHTDTIIKFLNAQK